jgi:hypothetical protein
VAKVDHAQRALEEQAKQRKIWEQMMTHDTSPAGVWSATSFPNITISPGTGHSYTGATLSTAVSSSAAIPSGVHWEAKK